MGQEINMLEITWFETIKTFWEIFKLLWWVWVLALGVILIELGFNYLAKFLEERRTKKWLEKHKTLEDWKKIDDKEFEKITAIIFQQLGYKTKVVGGPGDQGIDVVAKKEGKRYFIQCKQMDRVSPSMIRDFYGAIVDRLKEEEKGFFVTTGEFTQEGKEFAKNKPIELINGLKLERMVQRNESAFDFSQGI